MKRTIILATLLSLFSLTVFAQAHFVKKFGKPGVEKNEVGTAVIQTSDGNYALLGYSDFISNRNTTVVQKRNPYGQILWTRSFNQSGKNFDAVDLAELPDGRLVIAGTTYTQLSDQDLFVMVLSSDGQQILCKRRFGQSHLNDVATAVAVNNNGEIFLTGYRYAATGSYSALFLAKMNSACSLVWQKTYTHSPNAKSNDLALLDNGDIAMVGQMNGKFLVLKTDAAGAPLCSQSFGSGFSGEFFSVIETNTGDLAITGVTENGVQDNIAVYKLQNNCQVSWSKQYDMSGNEQTGLEIIENWKGHLVVAGVDMNNDRRPYLMELSQTDGSLYWANTYDALKMGSRIQMGLVNSHNYGYSLFTSWYTWGSQAQVKAPPMTDFYYLKTDRMGRIGAQSCYEEVNVTIGNAGFPAQALTFSEQDVDIDQNLTVGPVDIEFEEETPCLAKVLCKYPAPPAPFLCEGETLVYQLQGSFMTIEWFKDGAPLPAYFNNPSILISSGGEYCVKAVGPDGCLIDFCFEITLINCEVSAEDGCKDACLVSKNLVKNGDFDNGNTGFSSDLPSVQGCSVASYWVDDNATDKCNHPLWNNVPGAGGSGNYLIVDGQLNASVWKQYVPVQAGLSYTFTFKLWSRISSSNGLVLGMRINGVLVRNNISSTLDQWVQFCQTWTAQSNGAVLIEIVQLSNMGFTDYGIDDVGFYQCTNQLECPALAFNKGQYVTTPGAIMDEMDCQTFTLEAWIRADDNNMVANPAILSNRDAGTNGISFYLHAATGGAANKLLTLQVDGVDYMSVAYPDVLDGECHHVAVVRNGTILSFFADGQWIANENIPSSINLSTSSDLLIGKDAFDPGMGFTGVIKEVRIWKVARSNYDIQMAQYLALSGLETGLVALYRMEAGTGQFVDDLTNNGFDGVLGGSIQLEKADPVWVNDCCGEQQEEEKPRTEKKETSLDKENVRYEEIKAQLSVYPNPTRGRITILPSTDEHLSVMDQRGKKLMEVNIPRGSRKEVDISHLPNGLYFVRNGAGEHVKIVKQ